jgi:hypothetical protein
MPSSALRSVAPQTPGSTPEKDLILARRRLISPFLLLSVITSFITRLTTGQGTRKKEADIHRMTTEIILAPSPDLQPAPGITAYLKNSGKLEVAQHIANHESPRTTKLYDRRQDEISLDEIERIAI